MVGFACYLLSPVWIEFWAVRSLRQNVLSVNNSQEAGKAYEALFESGGLSRHQRLVDDQDSGIALRASWRLADEHYTFRTVSPEQFVERFKRRTGLPIPIWFEAKLVSKAIDRDSEQTEEALLSYAGPSRALRYRNGHMYWEQIHKYRTTDVELLVDADTKLAESEGMVSITIGADTLQISHSELHGARAEFDSDYCVARIGTKRSFVALHDDTGARFPLLCFDSLTGNKMWQVEVWGTGAEHILLKSGAWSNEIMIVTNDKLVAICGDAPGGCYAEAFDVESGSNVFRFCTGDWFCKLGSTP
jgi:hypothetical protein